MNIFETINDPNVRSFLHMLTSRCSSLGVEMEFGEGKRVYYGSLACNGYFTHVPKPKYAVATGKPVDEWLRIAMHEFAHLTQWAEGVHAWTAQEVRPGVYALDVLTDWSLGNVQLSPDELAKLVALSREVERDCEERTLKLMDEFNLPFDREEYAQKANAYIFFYTAFPKTRQWYVTAPYEVPEVWSIMPRVILSAEEYDLLPPRYLELVRQYCY